MNPTFEGAIAANPGDATAWQVYADWLIEQGEPWGEVLAAAHQGNPDGARQEAAQAALLGGFTATVTWHRGVMHHFDFRPVEETREPMHLVLERVLKHPAGHFMRKLTLGLPPSEALKWHMEDLTKAIANAGPLPCLEKLDMSLPAEHMDEPSWRRVSALLPMAEFGEQKTEVDDPGYRYPSVME